MYLLRVFFCKIYQSQTTSFSLCSTQIICQIFSPWQRQRVNQPRLVNCHPIINIARYDNILPCIEGTGVSFICTISLYSWSPTSLIIINTLLPINVMSITIRVQTSLSPTHCDCEAIQQIQLLWNSHNKTFCNKKLTDESGSSKEPIRKLMLLYNRRERHTSGVRIIERFM